MLKKQFAIEATIDGRFKKQGHALPKLYSLSWIIRKNRIKEMNVPYNLAISWGGRKKFPGREVYMESGFFYSSLHIDVEGLYQKSVFNTRPGIYEWQSFDAPKSAAEILEAADVPDTKYGQKRKEVEWDGVVLALQRPADRSIWVTGTPQQYYSFVEDACKYYGKNLFLKEHPSGANEHDRWERMAEKYGCGFGKVNHKVLLNAEFVLIYNSTIAVDCFIRRVPVMQYAPGYFYKTGAVDFTDFELKNTCKFNLDLSSSLADFLIWKYCFSSLLPDEQMCEVLFSFSCTTNKSFPLPEELSYAKTWNYSRKQRQRKNENSSTSKNIC